MRKKKIGDGDLSAVDWRSFGSAVIGVDEVGRGCLAGPVAAAACLFVNGDLEDVVTDSKKLTPKRREELSLRIHAAHPVQVGIATPGEIDEINILKASLLAMRRAVEALEGALLGTELGLLVKDAVIVVDGHLRIPGLPLARQVPLIKGDLRCAPVSAASIVAKVHRDRWMAEQAALYPEYGFEVHKGYSTAFHMEAIRARGPTILHRRTFAGVKEYLEVEV